MLKRLKLDLRTHASQKKKEVLQRFFKTGKGQYGEGDIFIGVTVPETRAVAKKYKDLSFQDIKKLLQSVIHEERLAALLILVHNYEIRHDKKIIDFYLLNMKRVNNWDLVDLSAPKLLGHYLLDKDRAVLYKLAKSAHLWERRIAIIATYTFIMNKQYIDTLKISAILLSDTHDLIHKAVGWMLREVGKQDQTVEDQFLRKHYKNMPRTMLRYSIEKFSKEKRAFYMRR